MRAYNLKGKQFGRLTVLERSHSNKGRVFWDCVCSCGNNKKVVTNHLVQNRVKSCGCLFKEYIKNQPKGKDSPSWKGGFTYDDWGYKLVYNPNHKRAKSNGYVREHIAVIEELLGRSLIYGEEVHHKNGTKDDNRPENLELWAHSQPSGQRVEDLIKWAKDILKHYEPEALNS